MTGLPAAYITIRGTRELRHELAPGVVTVPPPGPGEVSPEYDERVEALDQWRLVYVDSSMAALFGDPPLVAFVRLMDIYSGTSSILLDANLLPDIAYRLDAHAFETQTTFKGPRRARADERRTSELPLADIDAPLIRAGGRGGDYTRRGGADLAITGGLATVEKLIWHRLFTPIGTFDWNPGYGSSTRLKELRPSSLRAEEARLRALVEDVPGVVSAVVSILFNDGHALIRVRAETDFGTLDSSRPVGGAA